MMRALTVLVFLALVIVAPVSAQVDNRLFDEILAAFVEDGRVNYEGLCEDRRLLDYTRQLSAVDPATFESDDEKLAFWINAYNAFTLKLICDNYPVESINDLHFGGRLVGHALKKTAWDKDFITINGEKYTLNNIEHDIIRKDFDEPRIHFALVCAAVSCPPLRREAFVASRLDEQLTGQGLVFFTQVDKNRVDVEARTVYLSKIMDWYGDDFGDSDQALLAYVSRFFPKDVGSVLADDPGSWKVKYTEYDWGLND